MRRLAIASASAALVGGAAAGLALLDRWVWKRAVRRAFHGPLTSA